MSKALDGREEKKTPVNEWETPEFLRAQSRLDSALKLLNLDLHSVEPMRHPKRCLTVVVPVRMDDDSVCSFTGYRVHHDIALGPGKGGTTFSGTLTMGQVAEMAMIMSWKCALMNLPFGGAHGGICVDPSQHSLRELERITRRYTSEIISLLGPKQDIPGPDLNTDQQTMAWMMDTYSINIGYTVPSVVTGKPKSIGGSLGLNEATGFGVARCAQEAARRLQLGDAPTVVLQGYGQVGSAVAKILDAAGFKIIGVSDSAGGIYNPRGLHLQHLQTHIEEHGTLHGFKEAQPVTNEELLELQCDILAPCAVPVVITTANADRLQCRLVVEGANALVAPEADEILDSRGIVVVPDVLANASGVTAGYFEWVQGLMRLIWTEQQVEEKLAQLVERACRTVFDKAEEKRLSLRMAAITLAVQRIYEARQLRGLYP